ncbi:PH domain-containing protein [Streptomyces sp. TRM S81-3]|uniref:PH domain-containing protein n=1 Tax=Streptomyces griseicoloratus TaxID=2752516 RepID=A0A926L3J0_9ACTN|nr:PH domain-containing protein [Streptomyces griseicoloratus]MBD0419493.1 PH domain-containing protein [Streptomyces griseicoloratus]
MSDAQPAAAPDATPALPVTFRPSRTRAVLIASAVAILVTITAVAVSLKGLGPGERLSFVLTALLLDCVLLVLARPKVVADDSGVTVVNLTSKRHLEWAEILQVNLRPGDPWVFLDLSDGTSLPALGIQPGIARQRAIADARALRALTEARSGAGPEPRHG